MSIVVVKCKNCSENFEAKSRKAMFCCFECRNEFITKEKGELHNDYVICEICKRAVVAVTGIHLKSYHPEYTTESYKLEFPNALTNALNVSVKKTAGGKKAGARMREPEHRKRLSEIFLGDKNPMHRTNVDAEFRKSISPFNPAFYQKKFPNLSLDECKKLAEDKQKFSKKVSHTQVSYWVKKGYTENEAKAKISELQKTFSLEICIRKYGQEAGLCRWNDRQALWKKKVFNEHTHIGGGTSKIGTEFIDLLLEEIKEYNFDILYGKKEKFIKDRNNRAFKYDFTIKDLKLIFEFNGDYWHCNPNIWKPEDINLAKKMSASEIWKYDEDKKAIAIQHGYELITIWEKDFRRNRMRKIAECKNIINEKIKSINKEVHP